MSVDQLAEEGGVPRMNLVHAFFKVFTKGSHLMVLSLSGTNRKAVSTGRVCLVKPGAEEVLGRKIR